jgi:ABC-2 type transport system permease protein
VDFLRGVYYAGTPEAQTLVLHSPATDLAVIAVLSAVFLGIGTTLFVRSERNR